MSTFRRHRIKLSLAAILAVVSFLLGLAATGTPSVLKPGKSRPHATLIENVRLVSMVPGAPEAQPGQSVLIVDGWIIAVGNTASVRTKADRLGGELLIIEGNGRTLLPGLIDAHVHLWDEAELAGYLGHGVTGIRNMSGMPFHLPMAERIGDGKILGPDLLTTGPILNSPGPNQQDNHQLVTTADEARTAIRKHAKAGYKHLKVYSNLTPEPYEAILDEAEKLGLSVSGHTPEGSRTFDENGQVSFEIDFADVLKDGFVTIEHTESIFWHGLHDRLDEDGMAVLAKKVAAANVTVTPTLVAHANLIRVAESKGAYLDRPGTDTINPVLKMFEQGTYDYWSGMDPAPREAPRAAFYLRATKMMADAGVPLIIGTDAGIFTNIPGESIHDEFDLFIEAGIPAYETLAAATMRPAETLGFEHRGQIREGYIANLILVDGDPLSDISVLRDPDGVMLRGIWLDKNKLMALRDGAADTSRIRSARHVIALLLWL